MVVCAALIVPPCSSVYTPQELANKLVALDYGNGTSYAGLQMLESAMPREAVKTCSFDANPASVNLSVESGPTCRTVHRVEVKSLKDCGSAATAAPPLTGAPHPPRPAPGTDLRIRPR